MSKEFHQKIGKKWENILKNPRVWLSRILENVLKNPRQKSPTLVLRAIEKTFLKVYIPALEWSLQNILKNPQL